MKDWQLGFMPEIDDPQLGNAWADDDYGCGIPMRVLDEWQARCDARILAERARTQLLRSRKVDTRCMTTGDLARIMPKKPPLQLQRQGERVDLIVSDREVHNVAADALRYHLIAYVPPPAARWDYTGEVQLQRDRQALQQAQNEFIDQLVQR